MSWRALRRLQGDSDIVIPELSEKLSDEEESSATENVPQLKKSGKKKKKPAVVNPFDLVGEIIKPCITIHIFSTRIIECWKNLFKHTSGSASHGSQISP